MTDSHVQLSNNVNAVSGSSEVKQAILIKIRREICSISHIWIYSATRLLRFNPGTWDRLGSVAQQMSDKLQAFTIANELWKELLKVDLKKLNWQKHIFIALIYCHVCSNMKCQTRGLFSNHVAFLLTSLAWGIFCPNKVVWGYKWRKLYKRSLDILITKWCPLLRSPWYTSSYYHFNGF